MGVTFDDEHAPGLGAHNPRDRTRGQSQGEMPVGQGTRRRTQRLLRGPQVRVQRRPEALQPADFIGELLRLHRHAEEMLRLGRTSGDDVRQERPIARQLLGFDFALPNLQQQIAHGLDAIGHLLALAHPASEDHHLLELRFHRSVDAQIGVVARQPADQLRVEHVAGDDEDQHAAVLQQRQAALVEQLFEAGTALALIADVAVDVLGQVAIRRVEPEQPERLLGDHRVHQVRVQAVIDQAAGMACPLRVELDRERLGLLAPEGMGGFGDRHAFAGAGIEDAHRPVAGHQCVEGSFERGFVGRVVTVLGEIAGEPREHEGHGSLLVGGEETRKHAKACLRGWVRPLPLPASRSWPGMDRR